MNIRRRVAYLALFLLLPFTALGFSVHIVFFTRFVGHEEITRQAIIMTEHILKKKGVDLTDELMDQMTRIKKMPWGMEAVGSIGAENPIVFGNYAADKPDRAEWITDYKTDIFARNGFPVGKSMLKYGGARSFHFTLNEYQIDPKMGSTTTLDPKTAAPTMVGETQTDNVFYQSGAEVCEAAKSYIVDYSNWALEALAERAKIGKETRKERKQRSSLLRTVLFRIGVATHIIQDSFSPSHTFRSPIGNVEAETETPEYKNYDIVDVCYYDQVMSHAEETIDEWKKNVFAQKSKDDGLEDEDKVVIPPKLRLDASRKQTEPCAHGKFDKNDNVWLSTDVQSEILEVQQWSKWEEEIWKEKNFWAAGYAKKNAEADLQRYCNHNRLKSSDFSAFKCMKHEARLARTATMKYFLVLMDHVNAYKAAGLEKELASAESKKKLSEALAAHFFEGSDPKYSELGLNEIMPLGTMRCGGIKTPVYKTANKVFIKN